MLVRLGPGNDISSRMAALIMSTYPRSVAANSRIAPTPGLIAAFIDEHPTALFSRTLFELSNVIRRQKSASGCCDLPNQNVKVRIVTPLGVEFPVRAWLNLELSKRLDQVHVEALKIGGARWIPRSNVGEESKKRLPQVRYATQSAARFAWVILRLPQ